MTLSPTGPGVASCVPTGGRHAIAPRHDAHEQARQRFIDQLAKMLIEDNRARQFDELILIVAPGLSSRLRDALDEPDAGRVRETMVKDLTKVPLPEIHDQLLEAGLLPKPGRPALTAGRGRAPTCETAPQAGACVALVEAVLA